MFTKSLRFFSLLVAVLFLQSTAASAQQRRPIDAQHPLWLIHIDVWNTGYTTLRLYEPLAFLSV